MGESSVIEWTDATWNPWRGCDKVSPGTDTGLGDRRTLRVGDRMIELAGPRTTALLLCWLAATGNGRWCVAGATPTPSSQSRGTGRMAEPTATGEDTQR